MCNHCGQKVQFFSLKTTFSTDSDSETDPYPNPKRLQTSEKDEDVIHVKGKVVFMGVCINQCWSTVCTSKTEVPDVVKTERVMMEHTISLSKGVNTC